jgi:acetolactate synthase-1/2/3 large subunit
MKASDLFLKCLQEQGVKTMYGVPGEENADVMISLLDSPIEFISTRHEQTAAFMAEMHGRLTGIPGVCLATLGPGATNLLTGVAQANMDNSPLVAVIGQAESDRLHKESHQNMDSVDMYRSVTKWSTTIRDAEVIPEVVAKAFKIATSGIPGAVLIELPEDIAKHDTTEKPFVIKKKQEEIGTTTKHINQALKAIQSAKKPILLLGDGAVRCECDDVLKQFLKHTKLYSAHTFMGKGAVSHQYNRSLHCVGMGMKDMVIEAFEEADLVLCVGYDMVEYPPARWNIGTKKTVIHLNAAAAEVDKNYLPDIEMIGNIKLILEQFNEVIEAGNESYAKADPYFQNEQKLIEEDVRSDNDDHAYPMKPKRILQDIRNTLRDEDILVSDVGAHKMWVARQYGARQSKTCFISNGFCSMGGSMPGALEAKRLHPEKNVVALCGDGGFMMSIQAIATGVQLNVPFTVVLWEDDHYGLIKWKQEMAFNQHSHVDLANPDLVQLARAFGCHAERVEKSEDFVGHLKTALSQKDKPSVIVVPVDYSENMKLFHHLKDVVK